MRARRRSGWPPPSSRPVRRQLLNVKRARNAWKCRNLCLVWYGGLPFRALFTFFRCRKHPGLSMVSFPAHNLLVCLFVCCLSDSCEEYNKCHWIIQCLAPQLLFSACVANSFAVKAGFCGEIRIAAHVVWIPFKDHTTSWVFYDEAKQKWGSALPGEPRI